MSFDGDSNSLPSPLHPAQAFVWMSCRICGELAKVTQSVLDHVERTRPGTSDLCNTCWAKYGEYESVVA